MDDLKLFMVLIGCTPKGRNIEQHDIFFGIAHSMKGLVPALIAFWPESNGKLHVDAWREVRYVNGFGVIIKERGNLDSRPPDEDISLYFLNLGGYKPFEFEEYHYKMMVASPDKSAAVQMAKKTAFFKHTGYKGAQAHVDDKYGIDVDDMALIVEILQEHDRQKYSISLVPNTSAWEDKLHIGYYKLDKLP